MDDERESRRPATATWARFTRLALGVLAAGFLASLSVLAGFPPRVHAASQLDTPSAPAATGAQTPGVSGSTAAAPSPPRTPKRAVPAATSDSAPSGLKPAATGTPLGAPRPPAVKLPENQPLIAAAPPGAADATAIVPVSSSQDAKPDDVRLDLDAALDELKQSRESLGNADVVERRTLIAGGLFLVIFALVVLLAVIQLLQLRKWNQRSQESIARVEAMAAQLRPLQDAQQEVKQALPQWLQDVGEQPLGFQEEGPPVPPKALNVLEDIDHLAYIGNARLSFGRLSSQSEAAVYLNGLLLSASLLARSELWAAFARLVGSSSWSSNILNR